MFGKKRINTEEYLELKKSMDSLRIELEGLRLDFELIVKKLKLKYKISNKDADKEETEGVKNNEMFLP
jgi:hypothetical protein